MLTFDQHRILKNSLSKSLDIKRNEMPQIFSKDINELKRFLDSNDIKYSNNTINPEKLKPSQKELNYIKIEYMLHNSANSNKPIITSKDNYVVDGHHRWATALINKEKSISCIEIGLKIKELIELLHSFDKVNYKKISEGNDNV